MIVLWLLVLAKVHAAAGPIGTESTWLNTLDLDIPVWFKLDNMSVNFYRYKGTMRATNLLAQSFSVALNSPFAGAVDGETWNTSLTANRRDLLDQTTGRLLAAHRLKSHSRDINQTKEIDLHLCSDLLVAQRLELAGQAIAGVVDHDIDATKVLERGVEGFVDALLLCHVQVDGQQVVLCGVGEGKLRAAAGCRDDFVA